MDYGEGPLPAYLQLPSRWVIERERERERGREERGEEERGMRREWWEERRGPGVEAVKERG